ncbi:MAG: (d)CMP kinase [Hyphomicrobiales bacterium]|nr:(d)CMP kinase [Hyphomicrobiales bacterium]
MIIAIDGPAASGKSSLAARIASHYQLPHLNTGLLYRAVARDSMRKQGEIEIQTAIEAASQLELDTLSDPLLLEHSLSDPASVVAAIPAVRQALLEVQHTFICKARDQGGAVIEGRDIGTVICPDAEHKLYITATPEVRARRRYLNEFNRTGAAEEAIILDQLVKRDKRDASRDSAPLTCAADAYLLDTTKLDIEAALSVAIDYINRQHAQTD